MRIISGVVEANNTILSSHGDPFHMDFNMQWVGTYRVFFDRPFQTWPALSVIPMQAINDSPVAEFASLHVDVIHLSNSGFDIQILDRNGRGINTHFSFIAMAHEPQ